MLKSMQPNYVLQINNKFSNDGIRIVTKWHKILLTILNPLQAYVRSVIFVSIKGVKAKIQG